MKIEKLQFEKIEIEINETYVDSDGKVKERIRKVLAPTGKRLDNTAKEDDKKNETSSN